MKKKFLTKCLEKIEKNNSPKTNLENVCLVFTSDSDLAETANLSRWINANCGHDCCTCDIECK